jgi:CO/xanthine dehydrogenase FAD-binding subunit
MAAVRMPETMDAVLEEIGGDADYSLMAGGTDLLVAMREGQVRSARIVCLEKIPELREIGMADGRVAIGAAATLERVAGHPLVRRHLDLLCGAIAVLGSPPVVRMATLGGNICSASPAGDTLPPLCVLGAEVELCSRLGTRRLPVSAFITGPRKIALAAGEVLTRVLIPVPAPGCRAAYWKVGLRKAQSIAVVSLAALRSESDVRLAWGSVGPVVQVFPEVEASLKGQCLPAGLLRAQAERVERLVSPIDDVRATAAYRRKVAGNLLHRLAELERAEA